MACGSGVFRSNFPSDAQFTPFDVPQRVAHRLILLQAPRLTLLVANLVGLSGVNASLGRAPRHLGRGFAANRAQQGSRRGPIDRPGRIMDAGPRPDRPMPDPNARASNPELSARIPSTGPDRSPLGSPPLAPRPPPRHHSVLPRPD